CDNRTGRQPTPSNFPCVSCSARFLPLERFKLPLLPSLAPNVSALESAFVLGRFLQPGIIVAVKHAAVRPYANGDKWGCWRVARSPVNRYLIEHGEKHIIRAMNGALCPPRQTAIFWRFPDILFHPRYVLV